MKSSIGQLTKINYKDKILDNRPDLSKNGDNNKIAEANTDHD